jgi:zinc-binding alcohol dehydrogenase family protein
VRAVAYRRSGAIDRPESLVDAELPDPSATGRDLLVQVQAVAVNRIDCKIRFSARPESSHWKVLGWDVAGTVVAAGPECTVFRPGDPVFYAGAVDRPGANSQLHVVDERIVGHKPHSLDWASAAAVPYAGICAWEVLFERLNVGERGADDRQTLLVIGGSGSVGSLAIQLARKLTNVQIVATASRPDSTDRVRALGAHRVLNHSRPLAIQFQALSIGEPRFVFCTTHTDQHSADIAELIAPRGRLALIDDPTALPVAALKRKSVSIHLESVFTRPLFATADLASQGAILNQIAQLLDAGAIEPPLIRQLGAINAANLKKAHSLLENGASGERIVLHGWE